MRQGAEKEWQGMERKGMEWNELGDEEDGGYGNERHDLLSYLMID